MTSGPYSSKPPTNKVVGSFSLSLPCSRTSLRAKGAPLCAGLLGVTGVRGKVVLGVGGDIARPGAATSSAGTGREEISSFCRESLSGGDREAMIDGGLAHYVRRLTKLNLKSTNLRSFSNWRQSSQVFQSSLGS